MNYHSANSICVVLVSSVGPLGTEPAAVKAAIFASGIFLGTVMTRDGRGERSYWTDVAGRPAWTEKSKASAALMTEEMTAHMLAKSAAMKLLGEVLTIVIRSSPILLGEPVAPYDANCWEVWRFMGRAPEVKIGALLKDITSKGLCRVAL